VEAYCRNSKPIEARLRVMNRSICCCQAARVFASRLARHERTIQSRCEGHRNDDTARSNRRGAEATAGRVRLRIRKKKGKMLAQLERASKFIRASIR